MTKILIANDPHLADQPPLGRIDDYADSIFRKLEEIGKIAGEVGASAVVFSGDIWHHKRANRVSHRLVNRLINTLRAYPCPRLAVPGNHDLNAEGVEGIKRQPFWTLVEAEAFSFLDQPFIVGCFILIGRAWNQERSIDPKYYALTEDERTMVLQSGSKVPTVLMVAHGPIVPPGESRVYESISVDQIPLANISLVAAGHLHDDSGICKLPNGKLFVNLGSIARTARTVSNLTREPSVLLVEGRSGGGLRAERIVLQDVLPVGQIFEDKPMQDESNLNEEMVALVEALAQGLQVEERSVAEILATVGDIEEPVLQLIMKYLEDSGL